MNIEWHPEARLEFGLMGRAGAAFTFCYAVPQAIAIAAGARLIAVISYQLMLLIIAAVMTLAAGYLAARPGPQPGTPGELAQSAAAPDR